MAATSLVTAGLEPCGLAAGITVALVLYGAGIGLESIARGRCRSRSSVPPLPGRHGPHCHAEPDRSGGGPVDRCEVAGNGGADGVLVVFGDSAASKRFRAGSLCRSAGMVGSGGRSSRA